MISYWLDNEGRYSDIGTITSALHHYNFDVQIEQRHNVWSVTKYGRPWLLFNSHDEAVSAINPNASTSNLEQLLTHYDHLWFVCVGDQFLYTSESELEAHAFVSGLLVAHLVNGAPT